jgi:predicted amidophosphoribosyltransferase
MMTTPLRAHVVSDWALALLLSLTPTLWLLRRRPRAAGHCPHCGYDLRATPDRCPECGAETEKR